jgi:DNA/RNA endonuclease YhcR with UshA esterase domain
MDSLSMWLLYPITVSILLASLHVSSSIAADTMTIKDLKYNATSYQLKTVILHGTVKNLKVFPPYPGGSASVYGSYAFTLVDESGEVDVEKLGRSFDVESKPPVNEGDVVTVQGHLQAFHSGDVGAQVPIVRFLAQEVVKRGL